MQHQYRAEQGIIAKCEIGSQCLTVDFSYNQYDQIKQIFVMNDIHI